MSLVLLVKRNESEDLFVNSWFKVTNDIKSVSLKELKAILNIEFEKYFDDLKKRCNKCIISTGDYFEGGNINVE